MAYQQDRSPTEVLKSIALENNLDLTSEDFHKYLDANDRISHLRNEFYIPNRSSSPMQDGNAEESIYFSNSSVGLQPKSTAEEIGKVLGCWREMGAAYYYKGFMSPIDCDETVAGMMSEMVGALPSEVTVMNSLSLNLHLLLTSFYLPTKMRHKILMESEVFSSDYLAAKSQVEQRGFDPKESFIFVERRKDSDIWNMDDVIDMIEQQGKEIALVLLPGVHYVTGQVFDMQVITEVAHRKGCMVGFDLAHAVGNIELHLHDWGVDFAVWCSYKFLNSGPGSMGGAFLHQKHEANQFPKLIGWWGKELSDRFTLTRSAKLSPGIDGYRVSAPSPFLAACTLASLNIFKKTNMQELTKKSFLLTGYLEYLINHYFGKTIESKDYIEIITPPFRRGCQLSLKFTQPVEETHKTLARRGVSCDVRGTHVIRVAPAPLHNNFEDVFRFVNCLREILPASFVRE